MTNDIQDIVETFQTLLQAVTRRLAAIDNPHVKQYYAVTVDDIPIQYVNSKPRPASSLEATLFSSRLYAEQFAKATTNGCGSRGIVVSEREMLERTRELAEQATGKAKTRFSIVTPEGN